MLLFVQTDLMDLLGSDLPVESDEGMKFAWSDGILLQVRISGLKAFFPANVLGENAYFFFLLRDKYLFLKLLFCRL